MHGQAQLRQPVQARGGDAVSELHYVQDVGIKRQNILRSASRVDFGDKQSEASHHQGFGVYWEMTAAVLKYGSEPDARHAAVDPECVGAVFGREGSGAFCAVLHVGEAFLGIFDPEEFLGELCLAFGRAHVDIMPEADGRERALPRAAEGSQ